MKTRETEFYSEILQSALRRQVDIQNMVNLSGGCIHHAVRLNTTFGSYFIKTNEAADHQMFATEYKGLEILKNASVIAIPEPIEHGTKRDKSFILLEFVESGLKSRKFFENFGKDLAALHRNQSDQYGLDHDNFIGRLPQKNTFNRDWIDFFRHMRLGQQIELAVNNGLLNNKHTSQFEQLFDKLPGLLPHEPPSLLHGDLWGGNYMVGQNGEAVLIDPAVYYGNREIELSFTQMFGGFDPDFYASYQESYPLQPGFDQRVEIYNLYPTLVHLNMFGSSYLGGIERVLNYYC